MTRKEMEKEFAHPKYNDLRDYLYRVMDACPDIRDSYRVEVIADQIMECEGDGVELSIENAVRLTENLPPPPTNEELCRMFVNSKINDGNILDTLERGLMEILEDYNPSGEVDIDTRIAADKLTTLGRKLSEGNTDIVLMGIPDLEWKQAQLKIAFFTDQFTPKEVEMIKDMRDLADKDKFYVKNGIAFAIFYLYDVWK